MARMSKAHWLGEHSPQHPQRRMSRYDVVCVHTIVGYAPAHAAHFSTHSDGRIDQSRDTAFQSAANLEGNHRIIAVENEDHGAAYGSWSGGSVPPLTDAQVDSIAEILAWAHKEHGIPLQLCPDSRPGSRGLAYHRQGIDGNWSSYRFPGRVSGGEVWTLSPGKVCPGDARIAQLPQILARAKAIVAPQEHPATRPSTAPDRVERFLAGGPAYNMQLLRVAAQHGRDDAAHALAKIDAAVATVPKGLPMSRAQRFHSSYALGSLRLGLLDADAKRHPKSGAAARAIRAAIKDLRG